MEFFDKKEEVMEIQLTSYGKELLSKGNFKPFYYAFFDEGVMYDGARGGLTEVQNDIQKRIKDETPFQKDTKEYTSPDNIVRAKELVPNDVDVRQISLFDFDSSYENQLGMSKNNSDKAPAWKISTLQSRTTGSVTYLTASATSRVLPIPQIDIDLESIKYHTSVKPAGNTEQPDECDFATTYSDIFPDGTSLSIEEGVILLKVNEENAASLKDNFQIELFEVIEKNESQIAETKTKVLKPLKFFKFKPQIQNGIMLDQEVDFDEIDNLQKIDETFASNYFEILIDEAVDRSKVCELDPDRKSDDLFIKDPVVCPTTTEAKTFTYDPVDEADLDYLEEELQEDCE
tara:strand:- start:320 stop:1354 length:1035 start_codon:yes stop_codon:yes gene_type:complete